MILNQIPEPCVISDWSGRIEQANDAAAAFFGQTSKDLFGQHLVEFITEGERAKFRTKLENLSGSKGEGLSWRSNLSLQEGPAIPVWITVAESAAADKTPILYWLFRDMRAISADLEEEHAQSIGVLAQMDPMMPGANWEAKIAQIARHSVPSMAEWCFVHLMRPGGAATRLEPAYSPQLDADSLKEMRRAGLLGRAEQNRINVLRNGTQPEIVSSVDEEWLAGLLGDGQHARLLALAGVRQALVMPVVSKELLGVVTLLGGKTRTGYGPLDVAVCTVLARQCAWAIEAAERSRSVVQEFETAPPVSRDECLASFAHEIRNPVMTASQWVGELKRRGSSLGDAVLKEGLRILERNLETIAKIAENCVYLAQSSQVKPKREAADVNCILRSGASAMRLMAERKKIRLEEDLWPGPLWATPDPQHLFQAALNLIGNAIKFTPEGGQIRIRSLETGDQVEIVIVDSGIGIERRSLEEIFQPFRQVAASESRPEAGLGLGLSITRRIIESHGGRVWAESGGLGRGSTFRVRLPIGEPLIADGESRPAEDTHPKQRRANLLLIDDSTDLLEAMKPDLEQLGYTVRTAPDGLTGLRMAGESVPDVIISDIRLPDLDGCELVKALRSLPKIASTPVIGLTGFAARSETAKLRAAGFNCVLAKPAPMQELAAVIDRMIDARHI